MSNEIMVNEQGTITTAKKFENPRTLAKASASSAYKAMKVIIDSDKFFTKSAFEGLGQYVTTEDIEGKAIRLFETEIVDFNFDTEKEKNKHFHYSYWLGVIEETGESIIYAGGQQLTDISELLLNGQNEKALKDMQENGLRVMLNKIGIKSGHTFTKVTLLP